MSDPIIICPSCRTEIKLNESLAEPLIEATKKEFEQKLLQKDVGVMKREEILIIKEKQIVEDKRNLNEQIENQVATQIKNERTRIVEEESKKAKFASAAELENKSREVAELHEVLKANGTKLAEAQKAQAELIKKERELDDAKRELELTVEKH
jgi:hypothetical protein